MSAGGLASWGLHLIGMSSKHSTQAVLAASRYLTFCVQWSLWRDGRVIVQPQRWQGDIAVEKEARCPTTSSSGTSGAGSQLVRLQR